MKGNAFIITTLSVLSLMGENVQGQETGAKQTDNVRWQNDRGIDERFGDTTYRAPVTRENTELFNSGFIDVLNNGQVNAAARLIRLYIGEPGGLVLPLSFYSGVSANNFNDYPVYPAVVTNELLIANFINPLSGLLNVSFDGICWLQRMTDRLTRCGMVYQLGERVLTGYRVGELTDPLTGQAINFLNGFMAAGLYFQTSAGEHKNSGKRGICWLAARLIGCYTQPSQLRRFLPAIQTSGFYNGYSLGWGIEIGGLADMRFVYYQYLKRPELDFHLPIYQFSFNYSLRK